MNRAKKMKLEKKLKYLYKVIGTSIGGTVGCFIGYHLAQLSSTGAHDNVSTLSFFLSLFGISIGCISGLAVTTSIGNENIRR
ncbi:hypothetical protein CXF59_09870 [Flavobacterium sp. ALD4]|nr:hypothetical protein CXF59_09870 [Flavobacterium sp. ALD4]